jgi:2Fe-2S ferredoxin
MPDDCGVARALTDSARWRSAERRTVDAATVVLPHPGDLPRGHGVEAKPGVSICDNLLANGVEIEHACEKSCACTTCHVIVREGFGTFSPSTEDEDDLPDRAWGLTPQSRLLPGDRR